MLGTPVSILVLVASAVLLDAGVVSSMIVGVVVGAVTALAAVLGGRRPGRIVAS